MKWQNFPSFLGETVESGRYDNEMQKRQRVLRLALFSYLCAALMWTIVTMTMLATTYSEGKLFAFKTDNGVAISDFVQFYKLGRIATSNERYSIYLEPVQLEWTNKLISPLHSQQLFFAQCSPTLLILMLPVSALSLSSAYLICCVVWLIIGTVGIALLCIYQGQKRTWPWFVFAATAGASSCFCLFLGQASWLLCGFIALYCLFFLKRKDVLGGLFLALTTIKPQYTLMLAVPALAARRWRLCAAALFTEGVLLVIAGFIIGWQNVFGYPLTAMNAESTPRYAGVNPTVMVSLRGLLTGLGMHQEMTTCMVIYFAATAAIFILWHYVLKHRPQLIPLTLATTVLADLITSVHTHMFDCVLMAVIASLVLPNNYPADTLGKRLVWLFFLAYPALSWLLWRAGFHWNMGFFAANVVLFVLLLFLQIAQNSSMAKVSRS